MTTKPAPGFTMQDLLQELQERDPAFEQGDVMTTAEMAAKLGVSENTMRRRLRPLKNAGQVRVTRKRIETLNGRWATVTAWVV